MNFNRLIFAPPARLHPVDTFLMKMIASFEAVVDDEINAAATHLAASIISQSWSCMQLISCLSFIKRSPLPCLLRDAFASETSLLSSLPAML